MTAPALIDIDMGFGHLGHEVTFGLVHLKAKRYGSGEGAVDHERIATHLLNGLVQETFVCRRRAG